MHLLLLTTTLAFLRGIAAQNGVRGTLVGCDAEAFVDGTEVELTVGNLFPRLAQFYLREHGKSITSFAVEIPSTMTPDRGEAAQTVINNFTNVLQGDITGFFGSGTPTCNLGDLTKGAGPTRKMKRGLEKRQNLPTLTNGQKIDLPGGLALTVFAFFVETVPNVAIPNVNPFDLAQASMQGVANTVGNTGLTRAIRNSNVLPMYSTS
ncbi:hypothetical protein NA57DRAFT_79387 [Rhizodiscina lignyota]|uniref:Uncharacterized protein n=1 Tax=Rhizodiscina lignyota TaxID=1504668 RepID=A0A9P4IB41_9PEZI|nr:hypothetical protein NA57DRAFT_79387 [Rhizodiscina lignyota]